MSGVPLIPRTGIGIDVHAYAPDDAAQPLWLGGLFWDGERGLSGHSDGDPVAHAAADALFSACGIGDLGTHFGTDRPEYAGASGVALLAEAARIVGVPRPAVHVTHVLPGVVASASVLATIGIGTSILAAAGLSFLGLGPTEPTPEWGLMLSSGRNLLVQAPWVAVFPGLAITVTVVAVSIVGRTLRARSEERGA